eukprot:3126214-Amphidinium_carterae.1
MEKDAWMYNLSMQHHRPCSLYWPSNHSLIIWDSRKLSIRFVLHWMSLHAYLSKGESPLQHFQTSRKPGMPCIMFRQFITIGFALFVWRCPFLLRNCSGSFCLLTNRTHVVAINHPPAARLR